MTRSIAPAPLSALLCTSLLILCTFPISAQDIDNIGVNSEELNFLADVHPVLKNTCFGCHGDPDLFSELDLRTREGILQGGERGPAIVPGDASNSLLIQLVAYEHPDLVMPPTENGRLAPEVIVKLRTWIDAGAPWSAAGEAALAEAKQNQWNTQYDDEATWAFRPVKRYPVPTNYSAPVSLENLDPEVCHSPIDNFLFAKLNETGIPVSEPADRRTLIRRITYNLTGLPPTPEEVDDFVNDPSPDAYDTVMERLLASPHYGEQWGRHWLDVVRYADTGGFSNDYERPNAWRYRDYVIKSFNDDKPYDQFIVEQLAGDELDPTNPEYLIATGFLRMGPWEHTGMVVEAVSRQMYLDDVTQSTATTFLALTARCHSCHDHKFDPLPHRDYYRLQAVFAPVQFEERDTPFQAYENQARFAEGTRRADDRIQANAESDSALVDGIHVRLREQFNVADVKELPTALVRDSVRLNVGELIRVHKKRTAYYGSERDRYRPLTFSVSSGGLEEPVPTADTHILLGGSIQTPGKKVTPGVFGAMFNSNDAVTPSAWNTMPRTTEGRRLALANWIANPMNTLTARVMVNRIWQYHFGYGLVRTANNFGKLGDRPSHPELLDWLAQYFMEHRWSVKAVHRLILQSAAYQRSSAPPDLALIADKDPSNRLLSHFPQRRLSAEELRDATLLTAGALNLEMGGPGVFPEINQELALQPRQIMGTIAPIWEPSSQRDQRNRRTIYTFQRRSLINPMLEVFNGPDLNKSCERRETTTVTPQVFNLFNSQSVHDVALTMAQRLESLASTPEEQVTQAFHLSYGRQPTEAERIGSIAHLTQMQAYHETHAPPVPNPPSRVVRSFIAELTGREFEVTEEWDPTTYEFNTRPHEVSPATRALAEFCLVLLNSNEFVYVY